MRDGTSLRAAGRADARQGRRRAPERHGWLFEPKWDGFRALVFRDGDEVYTQSRDLKPLDRYFPELADPLRAALPDRCVLDGEVVIARDGALDFEALLLRIHPGRLAGEDARRGVAGELRRLGPARARRRGPARGPQGERRARLEAVLGGAEPPIHLTPATRDRATAADWFERFEGAGLDGVVAKRLDAPYQPGKRAMLKIKHQRTADCVVAGFRWHKNGPGTHIGSLLLGLFDDEGKLNHVGITSSFSWDRRAALAEELAPLREDALDGPSVARMGRVGRLGRRRGVRPAPAGRDVALEPRQGPVVGAAARGTRRRGRLRPPPGRPVPPRDDVQALAAGQAARGVPLRPARGDRAVPAGPHLRRRGDDVLRLGLVGGGWISRSTSTRSSGSGGPAGRRRRRLARDRRRGHRPVGRDELRRPRPDARRGRPDVVYVAVPPHRAVGVGSGWSSAASRS